MALSALLMGAGATRPGWFEIGASFIVVDTLVHNFLHRTGILHRLGAAHPTAQIATGHAAAADALTAIAAGIDARRFNPAFPKVFPRFVQHAIWRYCAQSCLDICNGNQIDDRRPLHEYVVPAVQPMRSAGFARQAVRALKSS